MLKANNLAGYSSVRLNICLNKQRSDYGLQLLDGMSFPRGKVLGQLLDGEFGGDKLTEHPGPGLVDHLASFWP